MEQQDIKTIRKIKSLIGKDKYFRDDLLELNHGIILGYCYVGGELKIIIELDSNPLNYSTFYKPYIMHLLLYEFKNKSYKIYRKCKTDFMTIIDKEQIKL